MLEFFKSLKPTLTDLTWLIRNCEFAKKNKNFLLK